MKMTGEAENWLKSNLNINANEFMSSGAGPVDNVSRYSQRVQSAHPKSNYNS